MNLLTVKRKLHITILSSLVLIFLLYILGGFIYHLIQVDKYNNLINLGVSIYLDGESVDSNTIDVNNYHISFSEDNTTVFIWFLYRI